MPLPAGWMVWFSGMLKLEELAGMERFWDSFSVRFSWDGMDWFCESDGIWVSFTERLRGRSVELTEAISFVVFVMFGSEVVLRSAGRMADKFASEVLKEVELISSVGMAAVVVFDSAVAFLFFMNSRTRSPFWSLWSAPFSIFMLLPLGVEIVAKPPAASFAMLMPPGENEGGGEAICCPQPWAPQAGPSAAKMALKSRMNANRYTVRSRPTGFKEGLTFKKVSWRFGEVNLWWFLEAWLRPETIFWQSQTRAPVKNLGLTPPSFRLGRKGAHLRCSQIAGRMVNPSETGDRASARLRPFAPLRES